MVRSAWRAQARLLAEACLAAAAFWAPWWLKWTNTPPFSAIYPLGFVLSIVLLLGLLAWALSGLTGLRAALRRPSASLMMATLIAFVAWAVLSQGWAFAKLRQGGAAQGNSLQIALWVASALCAISLASARLRRWMLSALLLGLLFYGLIGAAQTAAQRDLGLQALGEFRLDPRQSGVSVVESALGVRWLRPYSLTPHPNLFAGAVLAGLCAALALSLDERRRQRILGRAVWGLGLYLLLMSFSRGAWLALGLSALILLPVLLRHADWRRRWLPLALISAVVGAVFMIVYQPFVLSRFGDGQQTTEMRSIADRLVYTKIAIHAIGSHPLQGVGAGNFPWYAADYLWRYTDYDLRGDNVHNVALLVTAELGLTGTALLGTALLMALVTAYRLCWQQLEAARLALLALALAYLVVGLFDHYPYALLGYAWLWWASLGLTSQP
ncbi:MAG: O-antigen ligase family protein [Anaerolineae bacterium]|nr:O-antigen ligase family protein [Anaerolineae bacterium]